MSWEEKKRARLDTAKKSICDKYIDTKTIEDGCLDLREKCETWRKENESEPRYANEGATIYLQITPKKMRKTGIPKKTVLSHPLSLNRSVCYIGNHMDKPAQSGVIKKLLTNVGVVGYIKTISLKLVEMAETQKDTDALEELATLYDTHLVASDLNMVGVSNALNRHRKRTIPVKIENGWIEEPFRVALATTLVSPTACGKSVELRVGHVGMPVAHVVENVFSALEVLITKGFPDGFPSLESVELKCGGEDAASFVLYKFGIHKEKEKQQAVKKEAEIKVQEKKNEKKEMARKEAKISEIQRGTLELGSGLSALKELLGWKGVSGHAPRYTDEAATIYLRLRPIEFKENNGETDFVTLTHPLSMKRRVCLIVPWKDTSNVESTDDLTEPLKDAVKNAGVEGFIQIVYQSAKNLNDIALRELVSQNDTFIALAKSVEGYPDLQRELQRVGLGLISLKLDVEGLAVQLAGALASSPIAMQRGDYRVKVGHTGMSHKQLSENLSSVLAALLTLPALPDSLEQYRNIRLENGNRLGSFVYRNKNEATDVPDPEVDEESKTEADFRHEEVQDTTWHQGEVVCHWDYTSGKKRKKWGKNNRGRGDGGRGRGDYGRGDYRRGRGDDRYGRGDYGRGREGDRFGRGDYNNGRDNDNYGREDDGFGSDDDNDGRGNNRRGRGNDYDGRGNDDHGSDSDYNGRGNDDYGSDSENDGRGNDDYGSDSDNDGRGNDSFERGNNRRGRGGNNFGRGDNNFGRDDNGFGRGNNRRGREGSFGRGNNRRGREDSFGRGGNRRGREDSFGRGNNRRGREDSFGRGNDSFGSDRNNDGRGGNKRGRSNNRRGRGNNR